METLTMVCSEVAGSLERLLNDGWDYHDKESEHLARELEVVAQEEVAPAFLAPFLHLSAHTIGEHLGDWPRALALGNRVLDGRIPAVETAKAWGRLCVAAVLAGDSLEAAGLELSYLRAAGDDFGAALLDMRFMLAAALIGSKRAHEGARLYRSALDLVGQIPQSARLDRTIAVTSNNLGWELYEMSSRASEEDALMQLSADTSLKFWLKCGNWINAERGHYLKALVANITGIREWAWRTPMPPSQSLQRIASARSMLRCFTLRERFRLPLWATLTAGRMQLGMLMLLQQSWLQWT
jgi:hypothetical protein